MEPELVVAKRELRAQVRRDRLRRHSSTAVDGASALIARALLASARAGGLLDSEGRPGAVGPVAVAAYLAMPGEPDPGLLCAEVRAVGGRVLLPVPGPDHGLWWAFDDGSRSTAAAPIRVPVPNGPIIGSGLETLLHEQVRVVFVPALAVDESGGRLGQGGGYYDRLLGDLTRTRRTGIATPRVVAVVHDEELLVGDAIPVEPHDQRVDAALTPGGLRSLG